MKICGQCKKEHNDENKYEFGMFCSKECSDQWIKIHRAEDADTEVGKVDIRKFKLDHLKSCKKELLENAEIIKRNEYGTINIAKFVCNYIGIGIQVSNNDYLRIIPDVEVLAEFKACAFKDLCRRCKILDTCYLNPKYSLGSK